MIGYLNGYKTTTQMLFRMKNTIIYFITISTSIISIGCQESLDDQITPEKSLLPIGYVDDDYINTDIYLHNRLTDSDGSINLTICDVFSVSSHVIIGRLHNENQTRSFDSCSSDFARPGGIQTIDTKAVAAGGSVLSQIEIFNFDGNRIRSGVDYVIFMRKLDDIWLGINYLPIYPRDYNHPLRSSFTFEFPNNFEDLSNFLQEHANIHSETCAENFSQTDENIRKFLYDDHYCEEIDARPPRDPEPEQVGEPEPESLQNK